MSANANSANGFCTLGLVKMLMVIKENKENYLLLATPVLTTIMLTLRFLCV